VVDQGHGDGAGNGSQRRHIGRRAGHGIRPVADIGHLHINQFMLGNAGLHVHPVKTLADHEHGVAHDRTRQRDLHDQQAGRELVPTQGGKDRFDLHVSSPSTAGPE
jgi:hypothetical protein